MPPVSLSYKEGAVSYITGFVVKMVQNRMSCPKCLDVLSVSRNLGSHIPSVVFADNSALFHPSPGVHKVCVKSEKSFQRMRKVASGKLLQGTRLPSAISNVVLKACVETTGFGSLNDHVFDSTCLNNYLFGMIKCCPPSQTKIIIYHLGKQYTAVLQGKKLRKRVIEISIV